MIEGKSATRNKIKFVICYTSNNNEMLKRKQDELMHACSLCLLFNLITIVKMQGPNKPLNHKSI